MADGAGRTMSNVAAGLLLSARSTRQRLKVARRAGSGALASGALAVCATWRSRADGASALAG